MSNLVTKSLLHQLLSPVIVTMSAVKRLFGGSKKSSKKKVDVAESGRKLTEIITILEKKSEHLEGKVEEHTQNARRHALKNKKLAMAALKRKKRYEDELTRIQTTITTLEFQLEAISSAQMNNQILGVMGEANKSLAIATGKLDVDNINDIKDSIDEQLEVSEELTKAIADPVSFDSYDYDEDELLQELEEMSMDARRQERPKPAMLREQSFDLDLPAAPQHALPQPAPPPPTRSKGPKAKHKGHRKSDEDEVRALEAWAAT